MTFEVKAGFKGLRTDVGELGAEAGYLRVADNVVVRKTGAIEVRQGFTQLAMPFTVSPAHSFVDMVVHDGQLVPRDANLSWLRPDGTQRSFVQFMFTSGPIVPFRGDSFSSAQLRGNLYIPSSSGVAVASKPADATWKQAGMFPAMSGAAYPYGYVSPNLPTGWKFGYRLVAKRTDANGLEVFSRPSGAFYAVNTLGVPRSTQLVIYPKTPYGWCDEIEIYRTRAFPNNVQADDEMALVGKVKMVGQISWPVFFADTVPDSGRGRALYTSPTRGGMENAYDPPPASGFLEPYRGCLFFGNCRGPQRAVLSVNVVNCTGQTTGFGWRLAKANYVAGSTQVTGITDMTGVQVGQMVFAGNVIATEQFVTAISGSTVTLSSPMHPATASFTQGDIAFVDTIEIAGTKCPASVMNLNSNFVDSLVADDFLALFVNAYTPDKTLNVWNVTPPSEGMNRTYVIERYDRAAASFGIRATHGDSVYPPVPLITDSASYATTQDIYPNQLCWSLPDQPEHVPARNYVFIGDKTKHILGLCATRDSLFILKEDGVFRLSGYNGDWQIDPFDLTTFCVLPSSIRRLNGRIYLLSQKGVVAIDEGGAELLSAGLVNNLVLRLVDSARQARRERGVYEVAGLPGVAATVDERNSEYLIAAGTTLDDAVAPVLTYNAITGAWTRFLFDVGANPNALVTGTGGDPILLHKGGVRQSRGFGSGYTVSAAALGEEMPVNGDWLVQLTATNIDPSYTGMLAVTLPLANVEVGDVLVFGDPLPFVSVVLSISAPYALVHEPPGYTPLAPGSYPVTHLKSITARVRPHAFSQPALAGKKWNHINWGFSRFVGPTRADADYAGASPLAAELAQQQVAQLTFPTVRGYAAAYLGTLLEQGVPLEQERSWLLRAGLAWSQAFGSAVLELVAADERSTEANRPPSHARLP